MVTKDIGLSPKCGNVYKYYVAYKLALGRAEEQQQSTTAKAASP